jgi:hypothetical protein
MDGVYLNYWIETIESSLDECGIVATREQIKKIAENVQISHENYGLSFYSPPSEDRIYDIQRENEKKINNIQSENKKSELAAKTAISRMLNYKYRPEQIIIQNNGDVFAYDGRTTQIA